MNALKMLFFNELIIHPQNLNTIHEETCMDTELPEGNEHNHE